MVARDRVIIAALLAVTVALPAIAGAAAGSLDIPRNDDWSYRGIALRLFTIGRLALDGAAQTAVIGQVLVTQPLLWLTGGAWWSFLAVGILASTTAVVAGYLLLRALLDRRDATLAIGGLVLFPGYLAYVLSYMSDVPALASQFACLLVASAAIARHPISYRLFLVALAIGCFGFSVREFALAAPAAVLAVLVVMEPARPRTWLTVLAVGFVCLGILVARALLPGQLGSVPWTLGTIKVLAAAITSSFVLAPIALLAALRWHRVWSWRHVSLGVVTGVMVISVVLVAGSFPHVMVFGLITQWGAPHPYSMLGVRPELFPGATWSAIGLLALVATVLVAGVATGVVGAHVRRARHEPQKIRNRLGSIPGLMAIFALTVTVGLTAFGLVGAFYDRYLWPLIPVVSALLLYVPLDLRPGTLTSRPNLGDPPRAAALSVRLSSASFLSWGLLAAMSAAIMLNSNAYDGARWRAAQRLVALGYPAASTDAGPEWVHSHQSGLATVIAPGDGLLWYQRQWPNYRICAFAADAGSAVADSTLIHSDPDAYRLYLFFGPSEPFDYFKVANRDCP
jgi:hypothetical protein